MKNSAKTTVFVDALPLLGDSPSGIGKLVYSLLTAVMSNDEFLKSFQLILLVPIRKRNQLTKWNLPSSITIQSTLLPIKITNLLYKLKLLLPIDVIYGSGIYVFPNYRRLPLLKSRSITFVHDISYKLFPDTIEPKNLAHLRRVVPNAMGKSDIIVTLTQQSRSEIQAAFPDDQEKIEIVRCGVDRELYTTKSSAKEQLAVLQKYGLHSGEYFIFVGNIEPRKNIEYLLDIFEYLLKTKPAYDSKKLLLVGNDGWNNSGIINRINSINGKSLAPKIVRPSMRVPDSELGTLYANSSFELHLSVHEGFGMTPLEALAAGGRVAVADIPVMREVCGNAALYLPLDNAGAAATMIHRAITSKYHPTNDSRQTVLNNYTWQAAGDDLLSLLQRLRTKGIIKP